MAISINRGQTLIVNVSVRNKSSIESGSGFVVCRGLGAFGTYLLLDPINNRGDAPYLSRMDFSPLQTITTQFRAIVPSTMETGLMDVWVAVFNKSTRFADAQVIAEVIEQDQVNVL